MINQFVTLLATFIGEGPYATNIAWGVTLVLMLFALWLLRWLFNWFFKTNEIVANQEHIIELLEARAGAPMTVRQAPASAGLNMRAPAPVPAAPAPIRQHPIDEEFSEILNVRPHNLSTQSSASQQNPFPPVFTPAAPIAASSKPTAPTQPTAPAQPAQPPSRPMPNMQPITVPTPSQKPSIVDIPETVPSPETKNEVVVPVQATPANTSVTMLGSPEARAERQIEAREAMRLAAQAANSTLSKTADIPDIPTALVRTYATAKANPLTGKRAADRPASGENGDEIPSQFKLRNRKK